MVANTESPPTYIIQPIDPPPSDGAHYSWDSELVGFIGLIVMIAVMLLLGIWIGVH